MTKKVALEEEDAKAAADPPKAVAKRGKRAEPSAAEENKGRGGKKAVASAKLQGLFYGQYCNLVHDSISFL